MRIKGFKFGARPIFSKFGVFCFDKVVKDLLNYFECFKVKTIGFPSSIRHTFFIFFQGIGKS